MVKTRLLGIVILGLVALGMGCATTGYIRPSTYPVMQPVPPPSPGGALKVDNLLVIADVSRSMRDINKMEVERGLLAAFNQGIPKGLKISGMRIFGGSAYDHTVLVEPLQRYNRSVLAARIEGLDAGWGNTPLASALVKAHDDLRGTTGNIAIVVVSDGENVSRDPIEPTLALLDKYGPQLCIHTVHVGDSATGREMLRKIAKQTGCGSAVTAADLESGQSMKAFITNVFYRHEALDSDRDGVADWLDKCPDTPRGVSVDTTGCPLDSDGDGVPDHMDKCPNTLKGAPVNSVGCWTIKGVQFDYDRWEIKPQYYGLLDKNVQILKMNPTVKIDIQGHTDSSGSDQYNQLLSEKRAEAVKQYFISKGIDPARISSRGFGESKPVATNDTPEGRTLNRRIEVKIINR